MSQTSHLFPDGEAYERLMGRWSRLAGEIFLDWLDIPANVRWLDVGCGNGAFTAALIARCAPAEVIGIDPSEGQLSFARTRPGAKSAQFRIGDAQGLPFGDDRFDVAVMALVITFLSDPGKAVSEMTRVVRPGGWVGTYMWDVLVVEHPFIPFTSRWNRWECRLHVLPALRSLAAMPCRRCGKMQVLS
jgi:ubiquinone/menaquinone biosynthesis C-methylase UbiE